MRLVRRGARLALCLLLPLWLAGCTGGDNGPIQAPVATGAGFRLLLAASAQVVPPDGSVTLTASLLNPEGVLVPDGVNVVFSSNLGGTFSDSTSQNQTGKGAAAGLANGVATVIYTAPTGTMMASLDTITASAHGAVATLQLELSGKAFAGGGTTPP